MTSRETVIKTLNHESVAHAPRDLWLPGGEASVCADELAEIRLRYPSDIVHLGATEPAVKRASTKAAKGGDHTDHWGCVWHADQPGAAPQLKHSPLSDAGKIAAYRPPAEVLDRSRLAKINTSCQTTDRFALGWSEVCPFNRLRNLRGPDVALVDLARGTKNIKALLATLHDFACKELELWAESEVDGVVLGDDWGTAEELLVAPEMWREMFRPLYRQYCEILHDRDKFVFFRSEGNLVDVLGDLIKTGVDAIHCQLQVMGLERVAKRFGGRVTFWAGMDCARLHNPGTPGEFRQAVLAMRKALDLGSGGVISQCRWDPEMRLQTVAAFFEQWLAPLPVHEAE